MGSETTNTQETVNTEMEESLVQGVPGNSPTAVVVLDENRITTSQGPLTTELVDFGHLNAGWNSLTVTNLRNDITVIFANANELDVSTGLPHAGQAEIICRSVNYYAAGGYAYVRVYLDRRLRIGVMLAYA